MKTSNRLARIRLSAIAAATTLAAAASELPQFGPPPAELSKAHRETEVAKENLEAAQHLLAATAEASSGIATVKAGLAAADATVTSTHETLLGLFRAGRPKNLENRGHPDPEALRAFMRLADHFRSRQGSLGKQEQSLRRWLFAAPRTLDNPSAQTVVHRYVDAWERREILTVAHELLSSGRLTSPGELRKDVAAREQEYAEAKTRKLDILYQRNQPSSGNVPGISGEKAENTRSRLLRRLGPPNAPIPKRNGNRLVKLPPGLSR